MKGPKGLLIFRMGSTQEHLPGVGIWVGNVGCAVVGSNVGILVGNPVGAVDPTWKMRGHKKNC